MSNPPQELLEWLALPWWSDAAAVCVVLLLFAVALLLRRRQRNRLLRTVEGTRSADAFAELSLGDFEALVADSFRAEGYDVREEVDGVNLELRRAGQLYLVACAHWKTYKVPVTATRELYEQMSRRGAAGAFVITAGTFTEDAQVFVQGTNIELVDGRQLAQFVRQAGGER